MENAHGTISVFVAEPPMSILRRHGIDDTMPSDLQALGAAVLDVASALARFADRDVETRGTTITKSQLAVLRHLAEHGSSPMLDLAAAIGVTGPTMTSTVRILLRKGMVDRRHDDRDWRLVRVTITDDGRALLAEAVSGRLQLLARALAGLSAEQRALLGVALPSLQKLASMLAALSRSESL
jgi:DNA-binding MarR family transcriptional regulator